jgi:hypothetical protein
MSPSLSIYFRDVSVTSAVDVTVMRGLGVTVSRPLDVRVAKGVTVGLADSAEKRNGIAE